VVKGWLGCCGEVSGQRKCQWGRVFGGCGGVGVERKEHVNDNNKGVKGKREMSSGIGQS